MSDSDNQPDLNDQMRQRREKLEAWRADGIDPFGARYDKTTAAAVAKEAYDEAAETGPEVTVAGRLTAFRSMGKSVFADIRDDSDRLQVYAQKNVLGPEAFERFNRLDIGDIVGVSGELFKTRMGEITVKVREFVLLSKSLRPLPEKWHGLADVEQRYRQRYLDLISNPDSATVFRQRIRIVRAIRSFLEARGFSEVETPMMQPLAGGAAARPFITHYNALGCRMYMRIAPELYLKRLLVGGFEKVFELNRNFRNEGLDRRHNPEFTMLEIYQAYGNCQTMMELVEELITTVAMEVVGTLRIEHANGKVIDLTRPWRRAPYADLVRERLGADWYEQPTAAKQARARELGLDIEPTATDLAITHEVYEKVIEDMLIQPTFVTRLPSHLVPLAKACPDDPECVDVFELEINGQEIAPGYSELNDPIEQRRRFQDQLAAGETEHDHEEQRIDEDFLAAMEFGMPPAGGMGIGIDRLVMLLTGAESIRDVILFPQMRPRRQD